MVAAKNSGGGGEEFREAASGVLAGVGDQRWNPDRGGRGDGSRGPDDGQLSSLLEHGFSVI